MGTPWSHVLSPSCSESDQKSSVGTWTHRSVPARGGSRRCGHEWRGTQRGNCVQTSHVMQPPGKTGGGSSVTCKVSATAPVRGDQIQLLLEGFGSTALKPHASCQPPDPHQDFGKPLRTSHGITAWGRFLHLSLKQLVLPDTEGTYQ